MLKVIRIFALMVAFIVGISVVLVFLPGVLVGLLGDNNNYSEGIFWSLVAMWPFFLTVIIALVMVSVTTVAEKPEQLKVKGPFSKIEKIVGGIAVLAILFEIYLNL